MKRKDEFLLTYKFTNEYSECGKCLHYKKCNLRGWGLLRRLVSLFVYAFNSDSKMWRNVVVPLKAYEIDYQNIFKDETLYVCDDYVYINDRKLVAEKRRK